MDPTDPTEPTLRAPDAAGLDPRLAPTMARQHEATVAAIARKRRENETENDGGSR